MAKKNEFNIQTAKKYIFWVLVPLVLILSFVSYYLSLGSVVESIDKRKKSLDGSRSAVGKVVNDKPHPTTTTIEEIKKESEDLSGKVYEAWKTLEKDQRERNVWKGLNERVMDDIRSQKFLGTLRESTRDAFARFAKETTEMLPETVKPCDSTDAHWGQPSRAGASTRIYGARGIRGSSPQIVRSKQRSSTSLADSSGRGSRGTSNNSGGTSEAEQMTSTVKTGIVVWDPPVLDFTVKNWDKRPESYEVWFTQEEIWVYDALLNVIKSSNENVKAISPKTAAVKGIRNILIGKQAARPFSRQSRPLGSPSGGSDFPDGGSGGGMMDDGQDGEMRDNGLGVSGGSNAFNYRSGGMTDDSPSAAIARPMPPIAADAMPADSVGLSREARAVSGRYVDKSGKSLTELDADTPYRRMPIFMDLMVDQEYIPDVLTQCANCAMPIDVLWVRVNPDISPNFQFSLAELNQPITAARKLQVAAQPQILETGGQLGPNAVRVEIFGCINIFTPPDANKLPRAIEKEEAAAAAAATAKENKQLNADVPVPAEQDADDSAPQTSDTVDEKAETPEQPTPEQPAGEENE